MPMILTRQPDARLLLVGGGPAEAQLRAGGGLPRSGGELPLHRPRAAPRSRSLLRTRRCCLLSAQGYATSPIDLVTPLKPLEAMAQGKLVAASSVGGHRELIEDGMSRPPCPARPFRPDSPQQWRICCRIAACRTPAAPSPFRALSNAPAIRWHAMLFVYDSGLPEPC
jgi:glycosyltransferase involved in cell wall biosynthesis